MRYSEQSGGAPVGTRKLFIALIVGLLLVLAIPARTSAAAPSSLPIGLGFSQDTVAPVSAGIPIYAAGDQLWFRTYTTGVVNVTVYQPLSEGIAAGTGFSEIQGNTSVLLFTFSSADPAGVWTLQASSSGAEASVEFDLVDEGAPASLSGFNLSAGGQLALTYTVDSQTVYDLAACAVGSQPPATANFTVPASLGGGRISIALDRDQVTVAPLGGGAGLFGFWMTLSQDYTYQSGVNLISYSKEMQVAETSPVEYSPDVNGSYSTTLLTELPIRAGEFTLSANFQGKSGLTTVDTTVLVTGTGSWVWMQGCSSGANTLSDSVTVTSSLHAPASEWPINVYLVYDQFGVGLFSVVPVTVQPAAVELAAAGFGSLLTDDQVEVQSGQSFAVGNGTIYLVGPNYPMQVSFGTPQTAPQLVEVSHPYSVTQVNVSAVRLVIMTSAGGTPVSGARVTLEDSEGTVSTEISADGEAQFYVPPGEYSVLGAYQGQNSTLEIAGSQTLTAGQTAQVALQFPGTGGASQTYLLTVALLVAIAFNALVWAMVYLRRTRRAAPMSKTIHRPSEPAEKVPTRLSASSRDRLRREESPRYSEAEPHVVFNYLSLSNRAGPVA